MRDWLRRIAVAVRALPTAEELKDRGNACRLAGDMAQALVCYRDAVELNPRYAEAYNNIGILEQESGRHDEALACFNRAIELKPDLPEARWNQMYALLLAGDYAQGLALHEGRFQMGTAADRAFAAGTLALFGGLPPWRGEVIAERRLLLWTEQGLGDTLMMVRYLQLLSSTYQCIPDVWCEPELVRLITAQPFVGQVFSKSEPLTLAPYSFHCPIMSLPHHFGTRLDSIPDQVPYLFVPEEPVQKWRERLAATSGPKVGIAWAGNPSHVKDKLRSLSLRQVLPVLETSGAVIVSLQKGTAAQQLDQARTAVFDWMSECEDFLDTAGLIANLDLVIAVDTSVVHLAGALGKPVWLLNRFESEWRWLLGREDSPWYPTMRIFRQPALHDWNSVIDRVGLELRQWIKQH